MNRVLLASAAVLTSAAAASAGPWIEFSFGAVASVSGPFTVTTTAAEPYLNITDGFLSGDQFDVQILAGPLFSTSVPGSLGDQINNDYDTAFSDARWSSGSIYLGVGTFQFTVTPSASPFNTGGAAYRISAVPAPASLALVGLGGVVAGRRRRR